MTRNPLTNCVGFDDAPFEPGWRGEVTVVGTVFAGTRCDGVLIGKVRRDGRNATAVLTRLVAASKFADHVRLVLLQGIALAGFNVIDAVVLSRMLTVPVLVVARRRPDTAAIQRALLEHVAAGARKWRLIERLGPMEPLAGVYVQRIGLSRSQAARVLERLALNGRIPEPLRLAHLIAGAMVHGQSRGRA